MAVPIPLKSAAAAALHHAGGLAAVRWINRRRLRILMYHRFSDRAALARQCAHIRRHYHPVSMAAVSEWLDGLRSLPPYAVAVTVDDGYGDFQEAGYPVFAEYGIPATVFLATDFPAKGTRPPATSSAQKSGLPPTVCRPGPMSEEMRICVSGGLVLMMFSP